MFDIPAKIIDAAILIDKYFSERGIKKWQLYNICSRNHVYDLEEERAKLIQENARMKKFIDRFLDTEDLGYTFGKAMRDDAREALGMKRVET